MYEVQSWNHITIASGLAYEAACDLAFDEADRRGELVHVRGFDDNGAEETIEIGPGRRFLRTSPGDDE